MSHVSSHASIRTRLIITFMAIATIPLVAVSIFTSLTQLSSLENMTRKTASREALLRAHRIQTFLDTAASDLLFLSQMPSLLSYTGSNPSAADPDNSFIREKVTKQIQTLVARREGYLAGCYADEGFRDVICATAQGSASSMVPSAETRQDGIDVIESGSKDLLAGQIRVIADASSEEGRVFFVTRILPRGLSTRGTLFIEASVKQLLQGDVEDPHQAAVILLNEHDQPILGDFRDEVRAHLAQIKTTPYESVILPRGDLLTLVPTRPPQVGDETAWSFITIQPEHEAFREMRRYRWIFTGVLGLTLVMATIMSILIARQFTRPLTQLYDAAREIGRGNMDVELRNWTGDEIGGLAEELKVMVSRLREKHEAMQDELDEKEKELLRSERLSTIGTMSAAIAHEVHNPLGIILMYSQMLSERIPPDDPNAEKLKAISREGARIALLVRGLLQFARHSEPVIQTVAIPPLVNEAIAATRGLDERHADIPVHLSIAPECDAFDVDPDQFQQVLRNLLINACHAAGDGGEVRVRVAPKGTNQTLIQVIDTGPGIAPDIVPRLFEPFFTTKEFGTGTGLGLAIAKEIIENHGGTIRVTSRIGEGATFEICVPNRQGQATSSEPLQYWEHEGYVI